MSGFLWLYNWSKPYYADNRDLFVTIVTLKRIELNNDFFTVLATYTNKASRSKEFQMLEDAA